MVAVFLSSVVKPAQDLQFFTDQKKKVTKARNLKTFRTKTNGQVVKDDKDNQVEDGLTEDKPLNDKKICVQRVMQVFMRLREITDSSLSMASLNLKAQPMSVDRALLNLIKMGHVTGDSKWIRAETSKVNIQSIAESIGVVLADFGV